VPLRHTETRVVWRILPPTAGQCRGDPVGRPAAPWWEGTRDDVARQQDPPSPGAARRPLPARERRLFVASLETAGSVLSAHSTEQTLLAGNVGATRWVARRGRGGRAPGMMRCHRARSHQGDAPRRPYMSCPAACVLPTNIAARGRTRCRGGSRTAPTTPRDVHGANAAMRAHVHAMVFGSTAAPCPYNFTVLAFSSPACAAATILSRRTSPPTCRSTAQAEIQLSRLYQPEVTGKL
jgi:hypothetical protein